MKNYKSRISEFKSKLRSTFKFVVIALALALRYIHKTLPLITKPSENPDDHSFLTADQRVDSL